MNTSSPSQMLRYLTVKISAGEEPSRDGYGWHPLQEGRALLAWVADAPDSATQESAERIRHAVSLFLIMSPGNEERLAMPGSETEARLLLTDLVMHVHRSLSVDSTPPQPLFYAAAVFVLVTVQGIHFLSVGDCVLLVHYPEDGGLYRLSGSTRQFGFTRLDLLIEPNLEEPADHLEEAAYLGGQCGLRLQPEQVITLPLRGTPRLMLMSDGPERQITLRRIVQHLREPDFALGPLGSLEAALMENPPIDDLTLLAFEAKLSLAALVQEMPPEHTTLPDTPARLPWQVFMKSGCLVLPMWVHFPLTVLAFTLLVLSAIRQETPKSAASPANPHPHSPQAVTPAKPIYTSKTPDVKGTGTDLATFIRFVTEPTPVLPVQRIPYRPKSCLKTSTQASQAPLMRH